MRDMQMQEIVKRIISMLRKYDNKKRRREIFELIGGGEIGHVCEEVERYSTEVKNYVESIYGIDVADRIFESLAISGFMYRIPTTLFEFSQVYLTNIYPRVAARFVFERVSCIDSCLEGYGIKNIDKVFEEAVNKVKMIPEISILQDDFEEKIKIAFIEKCKMEEIPFILKGEDFSSQDDKIEVLLNVLSKGGIPGISYEYYANDHTDKEPYIVITHVEYHISSVRRRINEDR